MKRAEPNLHLAGAIEVSEKAEFGKLRVGKGISKAATVAESAYTSVNLYQIMADKLKVGCRRSSGDLPGIAKTHKTFFFSMLLICSIKKSKSKKKLSIKSSLTMYGQYSALVFGRMVGQRDESSDTNSLSCVRPDHSTYFFHDLSSGVNCCVAMNHGIIG